MIRFTRALVVALTWAAAASAALAQDATLAQLEVRAAGLAEAFTELTRDDNLDLQEAA